MVQAASPTPASGAAAPPSSSAAGARIPPSTVSRIVLLLSAGAFCTSVAARLCDPLLPVLASEFQVGLGSAAWAISAYAVAYGVLQLAIGPMGDRFGKVAIVRIAMLLGTLASLACALAPELGWLIVARVLVGGISGAVTPVAFAWIGDSVPLEERQPVLARVMSGNLVGLVSGQLVSGAIVDAWGWRWTFVASALMFAAVGVMLVLDRRRVPPPPPARPLQNPMAMMRGYLQIARPRWSRTVLAVVTLEGMLFGAVAFVPSALHDRFGMPLWQASAVAAAVGAGGFVYTLLARGLIARVAARGIAITGAASLCSGLALAGLAPAPWVVAVGCGLMGFGFYSFHNTLQVHGTQLSVTQRGMGMALFAQSLFVGQSIGVAVVSALVPVAGYAVAFCGAAVGFAMLAVGFIGALERRQRAVAG